MLLVSHLSLGSEVLVIEVLLELLLLVEEGSLRKHLVFILSLKVVIGIEVRRGKEAISPRGMTDDV